MPEYRVVIVDDEKPIVEGLKAFIDWEKEGFTVVGTASNGMEGLEMAIQLDANVVLTDVRMPLLSGNGLIERLKRAKPECEMIVLSGYSSFEYVQQAINNGAVSYLLKPIQEKELCKVLRGIRTKLNQRNDSKNEISQMKEKLDALKPIVAERFLHELLTNELLTRNQIMEKWRFLNENEDLGKFAVMAIETEGLDHKYHCDSTQMVYVSYSISTLIEKDVKARKIGATYKLSKDQDVVICNEKDAATLTPQWLKQYGETLKQMIFRELQENVSIGISRIHDSPEALYMAACEAQRAMEYRLIYGEGCIVQFDDLIGENGQISYPESLDHALIECEERTDQAGALRCLDEIFQRISKNPCVTPEMVYALYTRLAVSMFQYAEQRGIVINEMKPEIARSLSEIYLVHSANVLLEKLGHISTVIIQQIQKQREQKKKGIVGEIQQYVDEHYQENISLDSIEKKFYINASYLSYQFKKKVGKNFIDYLTETRIEKAKQLLADPTLKIYSIGEQVGYGSSRYFSKIFEKKVGMSPSEYRQGLLFSSPISDMVHQKQDTLDEGKGPNESIV